ncbi:MAG: DUF5361 domain-containing protein [Clostridiales bacterium]|nr:DUF5361 domain-containing protein [Clostridiales bacterium]
MLATDRDAVVCDLAETYGIWDMRALPVSTLATLAAGLRDTSRIKMKMAGLRTDQNTLLLAAAVDCLNWLVWSKTKDGQNNCNRPKSLVDLLTGQAEPNEKRARSFRTGAEFEAEWTKRGGGKHGN